jgi:pseudouridine-5'-phosphate glycosidase
MSLLHLHPRVLQALQAGTPIVVLESTVISHGGLGYPRNLQTAQELERQVEAAGAVPATIAVMHGQVKIGLDAEEMELLATSSAVAKLSKRDLAPALARPGSLGSTTVAATMFLAHRALGPCVFATGGLGGVHRGAFGGPHPSLDVSADLTELSRTPVTVVCSGVKSILDVPGTLEFLELLSVPVLCYRTKWFPTFFTHDSGIEAGFTADSPAECAQVMAGALQLATGAGLVVAVPNPDPLPDAERFIQQAERECAALTTDAARGKRATPWLLKRVAELSAGRSQGSNVALLKRNAFVAGEIAVKFAQTRRRHLHSGGTHARDASRVVVVGGAAVDTRAVVAPVAEGTAAPAASLLLASRTSLPGQIYVDVGGVVGLPGPTCADAPPRG